jgi:hypothetical protein
MRDRAGFRVAAALALAAVSTSGCQNGVTGPSLTATVQNVSLQPTVAGLEGGMNVCCCHLAGQLTNTSIVAVDAELIFEALGPDRQLVGTAKTILSDVPSGATRPFLAVGLPSACKDLDLAKILETKEIRLRGLWVPN